MRVVSSRTRNPGDSMTTAGQGDVPRPGPRDRVAGLVRRHQRGDRAALRTLVDLLRNTLLRDAFRILRDPQSAEDAFITTLERLIARLDDFERPEHFLAYARQATRNCAVDFLRTKNMRDGRRAMRDTAALEARRPPGAPPLLEALPGGLEDPETKVAAERRKQLVLDAVEGLGEPRRTAVRRYYLEGWALADIARELEMSAATVKRLLGAARVTLGARLRGLEIER